jgi:hypothetical protein
MQNKSRESWWGLPSVRIALLAGVAASLFLAAFASRCLAERAVRVPGAPEEAVRQRAVLVDGVMASYLPNRADARLGDMGVTTYRRGSWLKVLVQFTTQPDWIDEVRFDCYVLLRDGGRDTLLRGSVTCVHVRAGRQHYACVFVPPNVLERYGGRAVGVAVECNYQGSVVSEYSSPRTTRKWWQEMNSVSDALVTWFYTPFLRDGIERYEQMKAAGESS